MRVPISSIGCQELVLLFLFYLLNTDIYKLKYQRNVLKLRHRLLNHLYHEPIATIDQNHFLDNLDCWFDTPDHRLSGDSI